MFFKRLQTGVYAVNCFIIADQESKVAVVVDPGGDLEDISAVISKEELKVRYILLTHGHGDHLGAVEDLRQITGAQLAIHEADADMLADPSKNHSAQTSGKVIALKADLHLQDGQELTFGRHRVKVIHTPGHTKGGVCYLIDGNLLSGDTLFRASVGRTDLFGGNMDQLKRSINKKLFTLPDDTEVYPGHGSATTIGYEKKVNPYVR